MIIRPGHVVANQNLEIVNINDAVYYWTDDTSTTLVGQPLVDLLPELCGMEAVLAEVLLDRQEPLVIDKIYRETSDNKEGYFNLYIERLPMSEDYLFVQIVDVSEHARMQQVLTQERNELRLNIVERKRTEEALRAANASKDKFFSIVSHDLRSPLHGLMGYLDMLVDTPEYFTPEYTQQILTDLRGSSHNLYKLLENLLTWSRMQTGALKATPLPIDLCTLTEETIYLLHSQADQKQITLGHDIPRNTYIYADHDMIRTVLRNLVSNALKFTSARDTVSISCTCRDEIAEVAVSDTGLGMTPEVISKLFRIDEKHATPGTAGEKGTGLGLLLCHELVTKNGGKIWVESEVGKGTTFRFSLPLAPQDVVADLLKELEGLY